MVVKMIRRAKIWHDAGETVTVSPVDADFLIACGAAVPVVTVNQEPAGDGKKTDKKADSKK